MNEYVTNLLLKTDYYFEFENSNGDVIKELKCKTNHIPNNSGLYFVFCDENINSEKHLKFLIKNKPKNLIYFGKAGGLKKSGVKIKQGLHGRINNVVSDSLLELKDIKRAKYWKIIMDKNKINKLFILCIEIENPIIIENKIYDLLKSNNLEYPLLNKKLGRKSKITNIKI
jgi:hypothetical protein